MDNCQETSGFLFSHRCGRPGLFSCAQCHKRICPQHARPQPPEAFLCVTCAQGTSDAGWGSDDDDDDDPYFYSSRHRRRSGSSDQDDPMDFTEGDQAKLDDKDDAFEDDMGGS